MNQNNNWLTVIARCLQHAQRAARLGLAGVLLGLVFIAPAQAQINFRAAGAQSAGKGASITPAIPAGVQAGDLALLIIAGRPGNTTQPAAPAGWTLRSVSACEAGARDLKIMTFYRVLSASNPNPTVNLPAAWQGNQAGMSGQIAVWSGVNTITPFDRADVIGNRNGAISWTPPAISTVTPGARVVSAVATSDNNQLGIGTAQGFSGRMRGENYDTTKGGDHSVALADKVQATAGATAMLTWRQREHAPDLWAGITFALRPKVNVAPTVALTSPANNAVFTAPASIALAATATDDGSIAKVEFFSGATLIATDTTAPYSFNWTNVAAGAYTITARATGNLGVQTTGAARSVTVNGANQPPTVTLTSPANNSIFTASASIVLAATATDDGSIAKVDFYNGATLIGTVTTAPYAATWAAVPADSYTLTAKATDNLGVSTTSAPIAITVQRVAPAGLYFIHPDHLNTPRLITNQAGTVVWRWDNDDPFGNNAPNENPGGVGNFTCNLRFTGAYADKETGLLYNANRYRDTSSGRFIQADPLGLNGGDLSLYVLTKNNPLSFTDPDGLAAQMCC